MATQFHRGRPLGQSDFLEAEEVQKILSLPKRNTKEGLRDYAILLVLANTPLRKGELLRLSVGNLIRSGETPAIEYEALKKRKKKRVHLPIPENVYITLQRHLKYEYGSETLKPEIPLFRTLAKHGGYQKVALTSKAVDCLVRKYVRLAGISKRITPHSFRATYLTIRLDKGISPSTLRELASHESIGSTQRYLRTNLRRLKDGALSVEFK